MTHLVLAEFFDGLAKVEATFDLASNTSELERGSGILNRASYGQRIWLGSATLTPHRLDAVDAITAKLNYLQEADATFDVGPFWNASALSAGTVQNIGADRRELTLSEARPDGDMFGVEWVTGRMIFHVMKSAGMVHTVTPAAPLGMQAGDVATFGAPTIRACVTRISPPRLGIGVASNMSFDWKQVL